MVHRVAWLRSPHPSRPPCDRRRRGFAPCPQSRTRAREGCGRFNPRSGFPTAAHGLSAAPRRAASVEGPGAGWRWLRWSLDHLRGGDIDAARFEPAGKLVDPVDRRHGWCGQCPGEDDDEVVGAAGGGVERQCRVGHLGVFSDGQGSPPFRRATVCAVALMRAPPAACWQRSRRHRASCSGSP